MEDRRQNRHIKSTEIPTDDLRLDAAIEPESAQHSSSASEVLHGRCPITTTEPLDGCRASAAAEDAAIETPADGRGLDAMTEAARDRCPTNATGAIDKSRSSEAMKAPARRKANPNSRARLAGAPNLGGVYGLGIVRPQKGSAIVISHESALAFWRRVRVEDPAWTRELLGQLYPDDLLAGLTAESLAADTSLRPLELPASPLEYAHHAAKLLQLREPIDVVVGKLSARRQSATLQCRAWKGPVPDGLLANVDQHIFVCSPELVITQLAPKLGFLKTILLEMELCGSYAPLENGNCEWGATPLTSTARVAKVVELSDKFKGLDVARRATLYSMDGSASPRETALSLLLSLPRRMGGLGCGKPRLNARIELNAAANRECSRSYLVADLLFDDANLDVEYQGKEWHTLQKDRLSDEARQNALMMMGKACLFVSNEQIVDLDRMDGIAQLIRSRLGLRQFRKDPSWQMSQKRLKLADELGLR